MKKNMVLAFLLNLGFAIFELVGGVLTGSVAILSDALHDLGDAAGIGLSCALEKKSQRQPDSRYTYGYARYSVLGGLITTMILLMGSVLVVYNAIHRIINPTSIDYNGMILLGVVGVLVNLCGALAAGRGESLNQRAVRLHLLEDVLGWAVVLVGAVVMRFTDFAVIDPMMSIGVACSIGVSAVKNLKEILDIFLVKAPVEPEELKAHLLTVDGVQDVHHIHVWSMDGVNRYATAHIVTDAEGHTLKEKIRHELSSLGISHVTLELEGVEEPCHHRDCRVSAQTHSCHHHH